jgi:hypothetical protein
MSPDLKDQVEERARTLYPRVSSLSNYIVQLIQMDMEKGLIGPPPKGKKGPFEHPLAPFTNSALTVAV